MPPSGLAARPSTTLLRCRPAQSCGYAVRQCDSSCHAACCLATPSDFVSGYVSMHDTAEQLVGTVSLLSILLIWAGKCSAQHSFILVFDTQSGSQAKGYTEGAGDSLMGGCVLKLSSY